MCKALRSCLFCLFLIAALEVSQVFSAPVLNEFMAGPASDWNGDFEFDSRDDEWVEIANPGPTVLDLAGYLLLSGPGRSPVYGLTGTIAPGEFIVVHGSDALIWESENDESSIGLSLNNSGDILWLASVGAGDTTVVDSVEYASADVGADISMGRVPDASGGWDIFDHFLPKGGNGADPTPGASNASSPPPHIFEVGRQPMYPTAEDSVVIAVDAGDSDGIINALLAFDINLEDGEELPMTLTAGTEDLGTWAFTILPCDVGDTVHYRVSVEDLTSAVTRSPWLGYRVRQCSILVKINEILADPPATLDGDANRDGTRDASDDEFVELLNCGTSSVDISGWALRDASSIRHVFDEGIVVNPGEFVTVFGGGNPTGFSGGVHISSTGSLGLSNAGDDVSLLDAGARLIDFHSYASEGGRDESMVRYPDCEDHWTLPSGYGYALPFSPHAPNDPESGVAGSTWGGIKALYR